MNQDLIKTNIIIAGRSYPLKVTSEEKELVPIIEKQINTNIQNFQTSYPNMDMLDCVSMTMIKMNFDKQKELSDSIVDKLLLIDQLLSSD